MDKNILAQLEEIKLKVEKMQKDVDWLKCSVRKLDTRLWAILMTLVAYIVAYMIGVV